MLAAATACFLISLSRFLALLLSSPPPAPLLLLAPLLLPDCGAVSNINTGRKEDQLYSCPSVSILIFPSTTLGLTAEVRDGGRSCLLPPLLPWRELPLLRFPPVRSLSDLLSGLLSGLLSAPALSGLLSAPALSGLLQCWQFHMRRGSEASWLETAGLWQSC